MYTIILGMAIIGATVLLSHLGLLVVHRRFPAPTRQANSDVVGLFVAELGVIYAVLLAFVVVVVWQQFDTAKRDVEHEGNALVTLFRIGTALPDPTGARVRDAARRYAQMVVDEEWPEMHAGRASARATRALDELWRALHDFEPASPKEAALYADTLRHLDDVDDGRRLRLLANANSLPGVMWGLLIGGGVITVLFTYLISAPSFRTQATMTMLYGASLAFIIFLIALIDNPFRGDLRVDPASFQLALETFDRLSVR